MMTSWAKVSVGLATFSFINLVLFLALNGPIGTVFDTISYNANITGVGVQVNPILNMCRNVFGMVFLLSMAGLIIWFILGSHREEGESY